MRISPSDAEFAVCVSSLSDSLMRKAKEQEMQAYEAACVEQGFAVRSPAYDVCIARYENRADKFVETKPTSLLSEPLPKVPDINGDQYPTDAGSPPRVRAQRERLSCAQLTLEPGTYAFANCIDELDDALFASEHPI
jgi:hypothetical protein